MCLLVVLLGTVFPSHGIVEMSVSTGLLVVALSVEMVARKKKMDVGLSTHPRDVKCHARIWLAVHKQLTVRVHAP